VQIKPFLLDLFRYTSAEQVRRRPTTQLFTTDASGLKNVETCVGAAT
jgi:hypothetical protein